VSSSISVGRAIAVGLLVVNGPVMAFLLGPLVVFAILIDRAVISRDYNWVGLVVFVGGFIIAWTWWSVSVPRWRVWAYERVSDIPRLKEMAVAVGLTWPDGHLFERTERKSEAVRAREELLDPHRRNPR
jgi:MFS family permease